MNITEILIVIVNIAIFILPLVMLIENLIKRKYKILNICILINVFIWIYLSYVWNIQNPGFRLKCDARILNLIASVLLIASIITFLLQIKHKKGNKILIMIAIIFVFYIIITNDTTYGERTRVDMVSDEVLREYILGEHIPYIAFFSIQIELFINLLDSHKMGIEEKKEQSKKNKKIKNAIIIKNSISKEKRHIQ